MMKRISFLLLVALLIEPLGASSDSKFTSTQSYPDLFSGVVGAPGIALVPGAVQLTPSEIDRLILPRAGATLTLPSVDRFAGSEAQPLRFRQVSLFAENARIYVVRNGQRFEQARPARHYYLSTNPGVAMGFAVNRETGQVSGVIARDGDRLKVEGNFASQLQFTEIPYPADGNVTCGNAEHDLSSGFPDPASESLAPSLSAAQSGGVISYQAVIAIDTDTEWLAGFGDDTNDAMGWISDLFLAMNVFYERDVETRLLIGHVILRTGSDPYSVQNDRIAQLNEFGEFWMDTMDVIDRQFAAMLSGRNIGQWGFSGIAWIGSYCDYGHRYGNNVAGSYSYNAVGSSFSAAGAAHYVGHELGHNMGSPHTHCYSPAVDQCSTSGSGCYNGTTSCPADGSGTVMSYCHTLGGCRADSEFHPTVQARLEDRLASAMISGCIAPYTDAVEAFIFGADFEN